MDDRQILILLTIGGMSISHKCVDSVSVDRNFSDVSDKFTITLVDSPDTGILYDLELYMASGYRNIVLKYGDISENMLVSYTGTILDYTNTFVGNIKKLTITGIADRYTTNKDGAASWTYNIDWNSYYNRRADESKNYGAIDTLLIRNKLAESYINVLANNSQKEGTDQLNDLVFMASNILNPEFRTAINSNAQFLSIKGPSGNSIQLPIPDSFIPLDSSEIPDDVTAGSYTEAEYPKFYSIIHDTNNSYWGELEEPRKTTKSNKRIYYPSLYGFNMYLFMDKEIKVSKHADGTIKVDKNFLKALCGFRYYELPPAMKNGALSKEYWLPAVAQFIMGFSWTNTKKNSWYGDFDPQVRERIEMSSTIDAEVVWNSDMKVVAVYYIYKDATGGETEYGPFIAVKDNGWEKVMNEFTKIAYWSEATILNDTEKTDLNNDSTGNYYWSDKKGKIRAIMFTDTESKDRKFFVQANRNAQNSVYGGACIVSSGIGVDISDIVKKLAILEGWKYKDSYIVQTELVPNSDDYVMQNQTAMEFILNNLVPRAVTPIGEYVGLDGRKIEVRTPQAGFYPFFDDDGYFHFQPLVRESIKDLNIPNLGYNIPNTPVISFQINIKGTNFYTWPNVDTSPLSIVTGGAASSSTELQMVSDQVANEINKARHNDTFDAWLGLTYKDVEKYALKTVPTSDNTSSGDMIYSESLKLAQNALVNSPWALVNNPKAELIISGYENAAEIKAKILTAKEKIDRSVCKATMSMWGNFEVAPARRITVTNMLKGGIGNANYPQKHSSSGTYLILSMQDKIDKGGFIQNLNLVRFADDVAATLNGYKIDYSKPANYVFHHTEGSSTHVGSGDHLFGGDGRSF